MLDVDSIQKELESGEVVAVPTDTVYGLAVDFRNQKAVESLYSLKGRDTGNPFVILGASLSDLLPLISESVEPYASKFWPGPLTIVVGANEQLVPSWVRADRPTVGVRIPNHTETIALLEKTGPLAVTSANPSGEPAATTASELIRYFGDTLPVLEGESPKIGVASTVIRLSPLELLREGTVSWESIRPFL